MSCAHIAAVADLSGLNATRKAMLFALANACDVDGCWTLDRSRLASMAGVSIRTQRENLRWLQLRKMVALTERSGSETIQLLLA